MRSMTTYESDDTALLIVDPYNDFMSKGGKYFERTRLQKQSASTITWAS
jgi:ureidoacrylate peracid hydrolase